MKYPYVPAHDTDVVGNIAVGFLAHFCTVAGIDFKTDPLVAKLDEEAYDAAYRFINRHNRLIAEKLLKQLKAPEIYNRYLTEIELKFFDNAHVDFDHDWYMLSVATVEQATILGERVRLSPQFKAMTGVGCVVTYELPDGTVINQFEPVDHTL